MMLTAQMEENTLVNPNEPAIKAKSQRTLLWFGIVSIVMLFGGLTSAYLVRQAEGKWVEFAIPGAFAVSTLIIVLSSVTMQYGLNGIKKGNQKALTMGAGLTLLLGLAFVVTQYMAWSQLFHDGIAFSGQIKDIKTQYNYIPSGKETLAEVQDVGNVAGSFLYVITALHVLHLLGGILAMLVVFSKAVRKKYSSENFNGVSMCTIYWHFLGGLWVYLFFFLLYIR